MISWKHYTKLPDIKVMLHSILYEYMKQGAPENWDWLEKVLDICVFL